jgi:AcrR family transcriptional regulator
VPQVAGASAGSIDPLQFLAVRLRFRALTELPWPVILLTRQLLVAMSTSLPLPRWSRRKDARPAELAAAALALFVERGYAATRLEDVARRAGVSKGTLYLYFDSKEALFKAVVREGVLPALERGERMLEEHRGSAAGLLRELLHGWWEQVGDTSFGGLPKLMISECRNFPELGRFYYEEVISRGYRLIGQVIERGMRTGEFRRLDPDHVTRLVVAPMVLLAIHRHSFDFCDSHRLDPQRYLDDHLDLLLGGLVQSPAARGAVSPPAEAIIR